MTTRQERIEEAIRREIMDILRRKVADPRIGFVSVTSVDISPDFKNANVFVSILGETKAQEGAMCGLASATGFIQSEVGRRLGIRVTPILRFVQDGSIERGSRVLQIMNKLEHEQRIPKNKKPRQKR
ncbi:MAG TPA: 30S ribosome-binding factor RbfA [Candidatus Sulfotelmatobacter sp.]|nr:30S ribosome-binding factor RbfA [Candidatus Sulfotelmatobacter sp.]